MGSMNFLMDGVFGVDICLDNTRSRTHARLHRKMSRLPQSDRRTGRTPSPQHRLPRPQMLPPPRTGLETAPLSTSSGPMIEDAELELSGGDRAPASAPATDGGTEIFRVKAKSIWSTMEVGNSNNDNHVLEDYLFMCYDPIYEFVMYQLLGDGAVQEAVRTLTLYILAGLLAYKVIERWEFLDSLYFIVVTLTTVGYGDIVPKTTLGKLFTPFYCVLGITLVLRALSPLLEVLRGPWRDRLLGYFGWQEASFDESEEVDTENVDDDGIVNITANKSDFYFPAIRRREMETALKNNRRRVALAMVTPGVIILIGAAIHFFAIRVPTETPFLGVVDIVGVVDSFYWAVVTASTLGYGDIVPTGHFARVLVILYIPISVLALADAIADVQMVAIRKKIRETDYGRIADECLLRDAVRNTLRGGTNYEPALSESEFLIDQLLANSLVDPDAVETIKGHFRHLTRHGDFASDEQRMLTPKLVYLEIKERARTGAALSVASEHCDLVWRTKKSRTKLLQRSGSPTDREFRWKSFETWRDGSWQARVAAMETVVKEMDVAAKGYNRAKRVGSRGF